MRRHVRDRGADVRAMYARIRAEEARNRASLTLTANEPYMSATARAFLASELGDRYFAGAGDAAGVVTNSYTPFTTRGLPGIADIVEAASEAAKEMLAAQVVNFGCLSGVHAMTCTILATTEPGDAVMTIDVADGGHFGTKGIVERTGRRHLRAPFDVASLSLDVVALARDFHAAAARALYLNGSFLLNPYDVCALRRALGDDALIIYDASHTLGLIMGGEFQSPLREGADVVCGNTHKTLPGPQKGLIAFRDADLGIRACDIIDSGLYSSPHAMSMIALATTILEMYEFGAPYAKQVIANANAMGAALAAAGHEVRLANTGRYSENHQVHLITDEIGGHYELYLRLSRNNIVVNFDNALGGRVYIRLGTQEVTRRGMGAAEMSEAVAFIDRSFNGEVFTNAVSAFMARFQHAHYSFDDRR